jgi:hypothetical protein
MPDYQKGKIYKIYSVSNEELVYYGSTTETLTSRLAKHVYEYNNNKICCNSKLIFDAGDYKIELVENYPCVNKQQLNKKEAEYIRNNKCVNKYIPDRTSKEWFEKYYENNKEKILEKNKDYKKNNKEHILERNKQYYQNNKDEINEKAKEKVTCDCGCIVRKDGLIEHKKTNKHLELIQ